MVLWFVLGAMVGACLGWWVKKSLIVGLVEVVRSYDHYLVYLGRRIVARSTKREVAYAAAEKIIVELGGHHGETTAPEDQRESSLAPHAERASQESTFGMLAAGQGAQRSS